MSPLIIPFIFTLPLFAASLAAALSNLIYLDLNKLQEPTLRSCVLEAVGQIREQTCVDIVQFSEENSHHRNASFHFAQSSPEGPCGLDPSTSTIHLNTKCIHQTFSNESRSDACLHLIGRAITGQKVAFASSVIPTINVLFKCTDYCHDQVCKNGGSMSADETDCACQCPFNGLLAGQTCDELVPLGNYTDRACGRLTANPSGGTLKLSQPLDANTYCQFFLAADDPWSRIELEFIGMEMSKKLIGGSLECPDKLQVYGLESSSSLSSSASPFLSVKCHPSADAPQPGQHFRSASNFVIFQLEGNRFDRAPRHGPIIRYAVRQSPYTDDIQSRRHDSGIYNGSATGEQQKISLGNEGGLFANGNLSFVALLVVIGGVSIIGLTLVALRHHSTMKVKRNAAHHSPVPTSPIPADA